MAAAKRSISEVAGLDDKSELTGLVAGGGLGVTDTNSGLKSLAREFASASAATLPEEELDDEEEFDGQFGNTEDNVKDDPGADENSTAAKPGIDLDTVPSYLGKPLTEFNVNSEFKEGKPWLKPGADITDWFNYGFNEFTWQRYLDKQRDLRGRFSQRPVEPQRLQTIGTMSSGNSNNFLNEIGGMFPRFNRPMMPMQPPPFVMQLIQQRMQNQQMHMSQQQQQQPGVQQANFPNFRPNMGPPPQLPMQGQPMSASRMQTSPQGSMDAQNTAPQQPQQGQSIMVRSQQPMNPSVQAPQMQRPPFNFNAGPGRMPNAGPFRHPSLFANNLNTMMPNQQPQQGSLPMRPNLDSQQQPPPPSGVQSNQATGPPNVPGGPRRQLTSLTG